MKPPSVARRSIHVSKSTLVVILAVAASTAALLLFAADLPAMALAPALGVALVAVVYRAPIRWSANALVFLLLAAEDRAETVGQWRSPLAVVGDALHDRLDAALDLPGLAVTGMEIVVIGLLTLYFVRRVRGSRLDVDSRSGWPGILRDFLVLYVAAVAFSEILGIARGLPVAPWKLRNLLHPILLTVLFLVAYRRAEDLFVVGRVVVMAGILRALQALLVQQIAIAQTGGAYAVATNHGDSILLSVAGFLVLMNALERFSPWRLAWSAAALAILGAGAVANGRRIVWLMFLASLVFAYVVSPMSRWKRALSRLVLVGVPFALLYVTVGWNSSSRVFAPVQTIRGMADTSTDRSAYWREVENWNITMSIREHPILGTGLGGEYSEIMANDEMASVFKEYREWPHNTILGQILLLGFLGFTAIMALPALVIYLSVRSYWVTTDPRLRTAAMGCVGAVLACLLMAWGDTGAHYPQYKVLLALATAASARIATATGAWPERRGGTR